MLIYKKSYERASLKIKIQKAIQLIKEFNYYLRVTYDQMIGCVFIRTLTFICGELSLISCAEKGKDKF